MIKSAKQEIQDNSLEKDYGYKVISHIYGITLREGLDHLNLGSFTICDTNYLYENHPEAISTFSKKINMPKGQVAQIDHYYIIQKNIIGVTYNEVQKQFENNVSDFITTLLYCIPQKHPDNNKISITKENSSNEIYIKSDTRTSESHTTMDLMSPLYILDNKIFKYAGNNVKLFEYLDKEPSTQLEKKIKLAVNWIGQSLRNNHMIESFLALCVALETLLSFQDGFITPSITSQLSEWTAFLTEDSLDERKSKYKKIKDLYGKRSKIAHSGTAQITKNDYYDLLNIIKNVINKLFELVENNKITKSDDLRNYIDELKYSAGNTND